MVIFVLRFNLDDSFWTVAFTGATFWWMWPLLPPENRARECPNHTTGSYVWPLLKHSEEFSFTYVRLSHDAAHLEIR